MITDKAKDYGNHKKTPSLGWVEAISGLLDSKFQIPGTSFKFGLDPILGLFPVVGDLSTFIVSAMLFLNMANRGASRKVVTLMALNIIIDFVIGCIPFVGWIFDFSFKANNKNVRLLKEYYYEGKHQGSGSGIIFMIILILVVVFGLVCFGIYKLITFLLAYFNHTGQISIFSPATNLNFLHFFFL